MKTRTEIAENEAPGDIRGLYADIRELLGTGMVPLVFRMLAAQPGALTWCWETIRPLYADGSIFRAGRSLSERIPAPPMASLPESVFTTVGLDGNDLKRIGGILDHFNHSNPVNLISLTALRQLLEGGSAAKSPAVSWFTGMESGSVASAREKLPPLLPVQEMRAETIDLIHALQAIGLPLSERCTEPVATAAVTGLASIWRVLARWPSYLALALVILRSQEENGWLEKAMEVVRCDTTALVNALLEEKLLAVGLRRPPTESLAAIRDILEQFTGVRLVRICPVVRALQLTLPETTLSRGASHPLAERP